MSLGRINFIFLYKAALSLAVTFSFLLCLLQIESFTNGPLIVDTISITNTGAPTHDSHIPQICTLSQKSSNQNNGLLDFCVSRNQDALSLYSTLHTPINVGYFQIDTSDKIYIKNVTLLV